VGPPQSGVGGGLQKKTLLPPPASTNPISTKCTARNPCPTAPAANPRATTRARIPAAKSSSPPTRANRAPNSAPRRDPAAAHRGIAAGGRRGRGFSNAGNSGEFNCASVNTAETGPARRRRRGIDVSYRLLTWLEAVDGDRQRRPPEFQSTPKKNHTNIYDMNNRGCGRSGFP
jgi:hypothetical protein